MSCFTRLQTLVPTLALLAGLPLLRTVELSGTTYHVQGIELDSQRLWVTSCDRQARKGYLHQFSLPEGRIERAIEVQDGERYHPGGLAADGESLWIPVAEYRPLSSTVIQKRNQRSFALEFQFVVPDSIGCVAATPEFLIGGNWDTREFYFWNRDGQLIRKIANVHGTRYQDMKFDGRYLVASGVLEGGGAIDWLELPSLKLVRRVTTGLTDRGVPFTNEGMAVRDDRLYLLPEDGPSRLFIFRIPR